MEKDDEAVRACLALPMVQEQIQKAADASAEFARMEIRDATTWGAWTFSMRSPIEVAFYAWWLTYSLFLSKHVVGFNAVGQREVQIDGQKYRVDFHIVPARPIEGFPLIGVELDGHDFHERTKEQVAYRNQRDRAFQRAGWTLLHYSGTELLRNPKDAILDVLRHAITAFYRTSGEDLEGFTPEKMADISIETLSMMTRT